MSLVSAGSHQVAGHPELVWQLCDAEQASGERRDRKRRTGVWTHGQAAFCKVHVRMRNSLLAFESHLPYFNSFYGVQFSLNSLFSKASNQETPVS